jgi:hypothetical protein
MLGSLSSSPSETIARLTRPDRSGGVAVGPVAPLVREFLWFGDDGSGGP